MLATEVRAVVDAARLAQAVAEACNAYVPAALVDRLEELRARVRAATDECPISERVEFLRVIDAERHRIVDVTLERRRQTITRIHTVFGALRDLPSSSELLAAAPDELRRTCGFTRVMVSRIEGSRWVPETLSSAEPGRLTTDFLAYVEQADIQLAHMLLETEMVRRAKPAFVDDARNDPRTYKDIIFSSQATSYAAAPIMSGRRSIGFFHVDRLGQPQPVTAEDRDNLWVFTEHFSLLFERAVLAERLEAQRAQLHATLMEAARAIDKACTEDIRLAHHEDSPVRRSPAAAPRRAGRLSAREGEVLELMAAGATNADVARVLVLSEGTVKTHVHHILRKLHATNRAEAVARYVNQIQAESGA